MKTIIFDLDGTLLDTLTDLHHSVNYALAQHHYPQRSMSDIRAFLGNGINRLVRLSAPQDISPSAFEAVFHTFSTHYLAHCMDHTRPYAGVSALLRQLKAEGYLMAIVSNKVHTAVVELHELFFSDVIAVAIGESEAVQRKPAPDAVFEALRLLSADPEQAIYVGDSEVDLQTARNAGLPCISVTWGFRDAADLQREGALHIVNSMSELHAAITRLLP